MKKTSFAAFLLLLSIAFISHNSHACTTIFLNGGQHAPVVGKNFDYYTGECLVFINKSGLSKTALHPKSGRKDFGKPVSWKSKYASATFNPWGREFAFSGINEGGLVVNAMGVNKTEGYEYPSPDQRPSIINLQWIQYQLDNFIRVDEVIDNLKNFRVLPPPPNNPVSDGLHFMVCDKTGNCAVIEFLNGKEVAYTKDSLPFKVLTNTPYAQCLTHQKKGTLPVPDTWHSVDRFIRATKMIENYGQGQAQSSVDYAFNILKEVGFGTTETDDGEEIRSFIATEWRIVYDLKNLRVFFHTFDNQKIKRFDLGSFDPTCATPAMVFDIHSDTAGKIDSKFIPYTQALNRNFIKSAFSQNFNLRNLPDDIVEKFIQYPDSTTCSP